MRLIYFNIRGRGEAIRLLLEDSGCKYEDVQVPPSQWAAIKGNFPFRQIPALEDAGRTVVQSQAILRHLGRKLSLYGWTADEETRCDTVQEAVLDAGRELSGATSSRDFGKQRERFVREQLPVTLDSLQRYFQDGRHRPLFWVGSDVTFVDYLAWAYLDVLRAFASSTLEQFPTLNAWKTSFQQRPRLAAYLSSGRRPPTFYMPWNPFGGKPEES